MLNFDRIWLQLSCLLPTPVGFSAILMSLLSFLCQKAYPGDFLRPDAILSRSYLKKCSIWPPPSPAPTPSIINLSFFKNAIKYEPLGVTG